MNLSIAESELGWEVTYDDIFAPLSLAQAFPTRYEALCQLEREKAEQQAWNRGNYQTGALEQQE